MEKQSFEKKERVRKRKSYLNSYQRGARVHSNNFTVILSPNPSGKKRFGVTVSKKVGNAVKRNRIKRLLREFFRLNKDGLPDSRDMVIIAKKDVSSLKYQDVCLELAGLFKKKVAPMRILKNLLVFFIRFYQIVISPCFPQSCRFYPTCSEYAITAIERHGPFKGVLLGFLRILRCNPFSPGGYDPVK